MNRKIMIFYIEAVPPKCSQLIQNIFFRARSKYFADFSCILEFSNGFLIKPLWRLGFIRKHLLQPNMPEKKPANYFDRARKNVFSSSEKKRGYSFDVKNHYLSIYDVSSAFWARETRFWELIRPAGKKNQDRRALVYDLI